MMSASSPGSSIVDTRIRISGGNINAAQLFAAARKNPAIAAACDVADHAPLLDWLRENIHAHGGTLDPADLMERATGQPPATTEYLAHLQARYL